MKQMKIIAVMLVLALILPTFAVTANAADAVGFNVAVSPAEVKPGEQVEVIVSLTGYTTEAAEADAIRGLQVDITGVDTSVLSVVEYTSLYVGRHDSDHYVALLRRVCVREVQFPFRKIPVRICHRGADHAHRRIVAFRIAVDPRDRFL